MMDGAACAAAPYSRSNIFAVLEPEREKPEQAGPQDRSALIIEHMGLVRVIAAHLRSMLPKHLELEDLVQAGTLGLIDAAQKFDASKDVAFSTYAKHRIRGAILDSLREQDPISRDMRRYQKKIETAAGELERRLQREPTEPEIAAALDMDVRRLRDIHLHLQGSEQISASTSAKEEAPGPEFPDAPERRPDALCARAVLRNTLQSVVAGLPPRQQRILRLYYVEEMTMKQIGARLGVNESRVSQIHKNAITAIERGLRAKGIDSAAA